MAEALADHYLDRLSRATGDDAPAVGYQEPGAPDWLRWHVRTVTGVVEMLAGQLNSWDHGSDDDLGERTPAQNARLVLAEAERLPPDDDDDEPDPATAIRAAG